MKYAKTVFVVRHAKSSWDNFALSDHDRPLLPVGVKKTKRISKYLKDNKVLPDLLISSSAVRAYETAKLIAKDIGYDTDTIVKQKNLYHAGVGEIYDELYSIDNRINSVMIFGHNPAFTYFVNNFVHPEIDNLPTSGVCCIDFKADNWESISNAKFKIRFVTFPRMLK